MPGRDLCYRQYHGGPDSQIAGSWGPIRANPLLSMRSLYSPHATPRIEACTAPSHPGGSFSMTADSIPYHESINRVGPQFLQYPAISHMETRGITYREILDAGGVVVDVQTN